MGELPPKLFFRIGEVAGLVGVEPHVLRYWEREFRSIRPTKSAKGQRVYSRRDVENLLRVRDLLYRDGFTIAGAKKKLQRGDTPPPIEDLALDRQDELELSTMTPPSELAFAADPTSGLRVGLLPVSSSETLDGSELHAESSAVGGPPIREQLVALRSEVEAFLAELSRRP